MLLLRFAVRNHMSIRDDIVLDLTRPSLRTLQPAEGTRWTDHVYPLAAIFGANASGKSAIVNAFTYAFTAIRNSATTWQARPVMPRKPFLLDGRSAQKPSRYEIEFVHMERRHMYGFEVDNEGVLKEWLMDVPSKRWRTLFMRDREADVLKLHPSLRSIGPLTPHELVLSRSILLKHPQLSEIARDLVENFDHMSVDSERREHRLSTITESLANGSIVFDDIVTLLQVADIGVEDVDIQEDVLPPEVQELIRHAKELVENRSGGEKTETKEKTPNIDVSIGAAEADAIVRSLLFTHRGTGENHPPLPIHAESDGTLAWLALIVPAVEMLRCGGLYCIDEIDSSLHPHLVEVLLELFDDPSSNPKGAQLVFTSHDTYILSPLSEVQLEPEQVWFTDKSNEGSTELTSLSQFPRHKDANIAKRYMTGRYGGTPRLAPSAISRLLSSQASWS